MSSIDACPSVLIALAVVKHPHSEPTCNKYCFTDESRGFYLPAGRVDFGESFATAAVREAQEEAGCDIKITGIVRIEFSPSMHTSRFRCIYAAIPIDHTAPLKSIPDDETNGAFYLTRSEMKDLVQQKKAHIRASEVMDMFKYCEKPDIRVFPATIMTCADGQDIDNKKVVTHLSLHSKVIIMHNNKILLMPNTSDSKNGFEWKLPERTMAREGLQRFQDYARFEVLPRSVEKVAEQQGWSNFIARDHDGNQKKCYGLHLLGLVNVQHKAPKKFKTSGRVVATFAALLFGRKETSVEQAKLRAPVLKALEDAGWVWKSVEELFLTSLQTLSARDLELTRMFSSGHIYPSDMLVYEGEQYRVPRKKIMNNHGVVTPSMTVLILDVGGDAADQPDPDEGKTNKQSSIFDKLNIFNKKTVEKETCLSQGVVEIIKKYEHDDNVKIVLMSSCSSAQAVTSGLSPIDMTQHDIASDSVTVVLNASIVHESDPESGKLGSYYNKNIREFAELLASKDAAQQQELLQNHAAVENKEVLLHNTTYHKLTGVYRLNPDKEAMLRHIMTKYSQLNTRFVVMSSSRDVIQTAKHLQWLENKHVVVGYCEKGIQSSDTDKLM